MNHWNLAKTKNSIFISTNGFNATRTEDSNSNRFESVSAEKGFTISVDIPGPVLFYYEVTAMSACDEKILVGLASGNFPTIGAGVGFLANSYAIDSPDHCWISQNAISLNGVTKHKWSKGDVIGCGLVLNNAKELCILFTLNGSLLGNQIPINSTANPLYPTVSMLGNVWIEANFGDDLAKPFKYDIQRQNQMLKQKGIKRQSADTDDKEPPQPEQRQHLMQQQPKGQQQPPKKMNRKIRGQNRLYHHLTTVKSVKELDDFVSKNHCKSPAAGESNKLVSLNLPCKNAVKKCDFELWAWTSKSEYGRIHVYAYSHHNHPLSEKKLMPKHSVIKSLKADEEAQHEQQEHPSSQMPNGQHPAKKMTTNIRGQKKQYNYLKTVKSVTELEAFAFEEYCNALGKRRNFVSVNLPCKKKNVAKQCDYELRATRPNLECCHIDVYAHSKHNHVVIPANKRLACKNATELMPFENPPRIYSTPEDNIEWAFLETVPDNGKMHKIRRQNKCTGHSCDKEGKYWRIRLVCMSRYNHSCPFRLLSLKTTKGGYHIYKHGEHDHPVSKQNKRQKLADGQQTENKTKPINWAKQPPTLTNTNMLGQKNQKRDEEMPMENEGYSEDEYENANEDELDKEVWEEEYEDTEEDLPDEQGLSASMEETDKKKCPLEKPQVLNPTEPAAAAADGQGKIIKNENMDDDDDDDDIQIIEVVKQRKIGNAQKTADTGVGKLRDHSAQLEIDDNGNLSYKVDVSGCRPEEINVNLQGNKIVVRGEYMEQNGDDNFVHLQFVRSEYIPAGIDKATIKCKMDNDGRRLCISAQSESAGEPRNIPIIFEQSEQQKKEIKFEIHH